MSAWTDDTFFAPEEPLANAKDVPAQAPRQGAPCKLCDAFYGDSMGCDESKPQCSPHRTADGKMGPHPVADYRKARREDEVV